MKNPSKNTKDNQKIREEYLPRATRLLHRSRMKQEHVQNKETMYNL